MRFPMHPAEGDRALLFTLSKQKEPGLEARCSRILPDSLLLNIYSTSVS